MGERSDRLSDDHDLIRHLTDKDLRLVFSGLVQGKSDNDQ
jgi:hypothetical protein